MNNYIGIQYLRGLAAMMVVAHHAESMVPFSGHFFAFGSAGVDVFFVISGFVMAHSTRHFDPTHRTSRQAITFLIRRFIRVVPMYWLALLWTIKLDVFRGKFSLEYLKDFFFIARVHFTGNVWPQLIVGWTINYEMYFYAFFAIAMLAGNWRYITFASSLIFLVALGIGVNYSSPVINFYLSPLLLEFVAGVALYFLCGVKSSVSPKFAIGSFVIALSAIAVDNGSLPRILADGIPALIMVWAGAVMKFGEGKRVPLLVGDASYSIYLFHLGLFSVLGQILQWLDLSWLLRAYPVSSLIFFIGSGLIVGIALHVTVEQWVLRQMSKWKSTPS
jgi:exopolysaccharide production protein ExoZ